MNSSYKVHAASQFGNVLALGIRRRERANADAVLLGEGDPLDDHILHAAPILVAQRLPAYRAQVAFDVNAELLLHLFPQFQGNQVQGLLLHRTPVARQSQTPWSMTSTGLPRTGYGRLSSFACWSTLRRPASTRSFKAGSSSG